MVGKGDAERRPVIGTENTCIDYRNLYPALCDKRIRYVCQKEDSRLESRSLGINGKKGDEAVRGDFRR